MLVENAALIGVIKDMQQQGRLEDCLEYASAPDEFVGFTSEANCNNFF